MNYVALQFVIQPAEIYRDVVLAQLADIGFESFEETADGLIAYIAEDNYVKGNIDNLPAFENDEVAIDFSEKIIGEQNWNADWESGFEPIEVNEVCRVRAPFHPSKNLKYELVIEPKMSFGTGHHETTLLILRQLFKLDIQGKSILDMGTGTGVLAILAHKLGASSVLAIDVDEWAYRNALENVALNNAVDIGVEKGGADRLQGQQFQVILANINKNVLLHDMSVYANCLKPKGKLLLSGFFEIDIPDLVRKAETCGLQLRNKALINSWSMLELQKN